MSNVKARYLGGTPILMSNLEDGMDGPHVGECYVIKADGDAEFRPVGAEIAEGERLLMSDAGAFLVTGDVILLDRYSAEGREDFEVVGAKPKAAKKPKAAAAAEKE